MEIPENLFDYIKDQARKVHHGRITIEINDTNQKMDVIVESRQRFFKEKNVPVIGTGYPSKKSMQKTA